MFQRVCLQGDWQPPGHRVTTELNLPHSRCPGKGQGSTYHLCCWWEVRVGVFRLKSSSCVTFMLLVAAGGVKYWGRRTRRRAFAWLSNDQSQTPKPESSRSSQFWTPAHSHSRSTTFSVTFQKLAFIPLIRPHVSSTLVSLPETILSFTITHSLKGLWWKSGTIGLKMLSSVWRNDRTLPADGWWSHLWKSASWWIKLSSLEPVSHLTIIWRAATQSVSPCLITRAVPFDERDPLIWSTLDAKMHHFTQHFPSQSETSSCSQASLGFSSSGWHVTPLSSLTLPVSFLLHAPPHTSHITAE